MSSDPTNPKHPLRQSWSFWFLKRQTGTASKAQEAYEKGITKLASFATAEDFWGVYNHVVRPSDVPMPLDFHLFREGVKPMWEDSENEHGGRFILRVPRGKRISSRYWEDLVFAVIGSQFEVPDDEICGVVISSRFQFDMLSVWTKHSDNAEIKATLEADLKRVLKLPGHFKVEFKAASQILDLGRGHNESKNEVSNPAPRPQGTKAPKKRQNRDKKGAKAEEATGQFENEEAAEEGDEGQNDEAL